MRYSITPLPTLLALDVFPILIRSRPTVTLAAAVASSRVNQAAKALHPWPSIYSRTSIMRKK